MVWRSPIPAWRGGNVGNARERRTRAGDVRLAAAALGPRGGAGAADLVVPSQIAGRVPLRLGRAIYIQRELREHCTHE